MPALHKVGEIEVVKYRWLWQECEECGNPAQFRVTYLLHGARGNPESKAYGRDDCSWSADEERWACRRCVRKVEHGPPAGTLYCATFPLARFQHLGWFKQLVK